MLDIIIDNTYPLRNLATPYPALTPEDMLGLYPWLPPVYAVGRASVWNDQAAGRYTMGSFLLWCQTQDDDIRKKAERRRESMARYRARVKVGLAGAPGRQALYSPEEAAQRRRESMARYQAKIRAGQPVRRQGRPKVYASATSAEGARQAVSRYRAKLKAARIAEQISSLV